MAGERTSIFGNDDLDVSAFAPAQGRRPTPAADRDAIREVAEQRGFESREPARGGGQAAAKAVPRAQRRHTTGRNKQLNIKATDEAIVRFYAIADRHGWVLGEVFERAIEALERQEGAGN